MHVNVDIVAVLARTTTVPPGIADGDRVRNAGGGSCACETVAANWNHDSKLVMSFTRL